MAYAGPEAKDAKVTAAIASSIWSAYEKNGKLAFYNEDLKMVFMDCEVNTCLYINPFSRTTMQDDKKYQ